jgi:hypothetical protein
MPETKIKLMPEINPFHVQACKIMYLVLVLGLLFLTDWLVPSVHILDSLPFAFTKTSSRNTA